MKNATLKSLDFNETNISIEGLPNKKLKSVAQNIALHEKRNIEEINFVRQNNNEWQMNQGIQPTGYIWFVKENEID